MQSKIRTKIISRINLLIAVLLGLALFQAIIFSFWVPSRSQTPLKLPIFVGSLGKKEVRSELPVRIKIPKIRVDTTLERVGLASDGSVGIPSGPGNAAWFELSPRPGEKGNAIITGHFGWKNGIPAVFDDLYKLIKGDKIYVEDETGTSTVFIVRESKRYDPKTSASFVFISNDEKSHLNLITCEGIWNKTQKSYSKRLVVFADKEENKKIK